MDTMPDEFSDINLDWYFCEEGSVSPVELKPSRKTEQKNPDLLQAKSISRLHELKKARRKRDVRRLFKVSSTRTVSEPPVVVRLHCAEELTFEESPVLNPVRPVATQVSVGQGCLEGLSLVPLDLDLTTVI